MRAGSGAGSLAMRIAAAHPQQSTNPPGEDVLAVARALAILHARMDHVAELARLSARETPQARATETS